MKLPPQLLSRKTGSAVLLLGATAFLCFTPSLAADFQQVLEPREWAFPRDHGRHDGYRMEWWYFSGNLTNAAGRRIGYELAFFRSVREPGAASRESRSGAGDFYFAHAAVSDLQLYRLRNKDGTETRFGSLDDRGKTRYLKAEEITMTPSDSQKAPSGAAYPQHWEISVTGLPAFTIQTAFPGQELWMPQAAGETYFEGVTDAEAAGKPLGRGYLEMTGYLNR
jgi:predicted secreted hydrolase